MSPQGVRRHPALSATCRAQLTSPPVAQPCSHIVPLKQTAALAVLCGSGDMLADRQTHTDHNTLLPTGDRAITVTRC